MGSQQRLKELFLLDTCAWLWIANSDKRITSKIRKTLNEADWLVSAISVWEVAMLEAKKRVELNQPLELWIDKALMKVPGILLAPLSPNISVKSCNLQDFKHPDPADRIILATAIMRQATLVTADTKLINYCNFQRLPVVAI